MCDYRFLWFNGIVYYEIGVFYICKYLLIIFYVCFLLLRFRKKIFFIKDCLN